ncbi:MAG: Rrf2 family transcriptional regulator [Acidimicrobiia bacterium]|nr:Rrf2 family transcriptional regulator [Acidimicrobiia bacterium]
MRLELTTRTDLALRALRSLHDAGTRVKRADLAAELDTTPDFLARVVAPLVRQKWVTSERGPSGGYATDVSVASVSVFDLVAAIEGVPDESRCVLRSGPCDANERCALHDAWTRARNALTAELQTTRIID